MNVCGLKSKHILPDFTNFIANFDIIGFQETKLTEYDDVQLCDFKLFTKNRTSRSRVASGGIALAVKKTISNCVTVINSSSSLVLWFKVSKKLTKYDTDILCGIIYIPPENTRYSSNDPFNEIQLELDSLRSEFDNVILFGDFNARTGSHNEFVDFDDFVLHELNIDALEWEYNAERSVFDRNNISTSRTVRDKCSNNYGYKLIDFCKYNDFFILNGRMGKDQMHGSFTCRNASCVDYFVSNLNMFDFLGDMSVDEFCPLLSDVHNPIKLTVQIRSESFETTPEGETSSKHLLWDRYCPEKFVDCIDVLKISEIESKLDFFSETGVKTKNDIDLLVQDICNLFTNTADKAYGKKRSGKLAYNFNKKTNNSKTKDWFGPKCAAARKDFLTAKNRFRRSHTLLDKHTMKMKGKQYRKITHIYHRRFIDKNACKLKELKSKDPKTFWRFVTGKEKSKVKVGVNEFYEFMEKVNTDTQNQGEATLNLDMHGCLFDEQLNSSISTDEIKQNALKLLNDKACGLDLVMNEHIKSTLHIMLPVYHKLFNIVFDTGIIPTAWTKGCIIPIYKKKGNELDPENYRPITLLSCLGKLFTAIINARLQNLNVIEENQTGFRKKYSTIDNIFALRVLFDLLSKDKRKIYCAFIDFKRAFDTVWRAGLWQKLLNSEVKGKCFNVIYNIYKEIKSCVLVNDKYSNFFQCSVGVRQGENLSPFLFALYLNDLEYYLRTNNVNGIDCTLATDEIFMFFKLFVLLYADDTVLLAETSEDLQHALNIFEQFCRNWKLTVNTEKTKIMVFGRGRRSNSLKFFFDNTPIEIVENFKYLGVILSRGGSFQRTLKHNREQAYKAMFILVRKLKGLNLAVDVQLDLFNRMIKPILLYGCEVWGYNEITILERVQLKFLKSIFGLKQSTPNVMIYGEFGVYPIEIDVKARMVSYWTKLIEPGSLKFSSLLYRFIFNNPCTNISPWIAYVKTIIENCGYSGIWNAQIVQNPHWLVKSIKQKLTDLFINEWHSAVETSVSCLNYRIFKTYFTLEKYLLKLPGPMKKNLCFFRTRNHHLPVETGKWFNIDFADRKCNLCNDPLGDEFHYLLSCSSLSLQRKQYVKPYYYQQPNILKFSQLMNVSNIKELKNLSKFISIILKIT